PPSGGCVLKHGKFWKVLPLDLPAAFGRLCVETALSSLRYNVISQPPSGGCVLKQRIIEEVWYEFGPSRLRAAVC
ncbi:hypothetical protein, partial [Neisseria sp. HMSC056A04]|uniref:hypothetical protein n=1 Tax=Neisseria sp. HMSC056A04 TaxID=1715047 RepID=UPI001AEFE0B6